MKKISPTKAAREVCLCLSGWCHPRTQTCRAQLDCRREKEREAQDRTRVYCLQDETARKGKAGIQSSTASHRCHYRSQKSRPRGQHHWFPHHGTCQAGQEQAHGRVPPCHSPSTVVPALGCTLAALCVRGAGEEGKHPSSWIPIIKASPMLLVGVLLNRSPPGSSGSAGKNAALNKAALNNH